MSEARLEAHCSHIADYYDHEWFGHKTIGSNLLRHGYRQWAEGRAVAVAFGMPANNLFTPPLETPNEDQ